MRSFNRSAGYMSRTLPDADDAYGRGDRRPDSPFRGGGFLRTVRAVRPADRVHCRGATRRGGHRFRPRCSARRVSPFTADSRTRHQRYLSTTTRIRIRSSVVTHDDDGKRESASRSTTDVWKRMEMCERKKIINRKHDKFG